MLEGMLDSPLSNTKVPVGFRENRPREEKCGGNRRGECSLIRSSGRATASGRDQGRDFDPSGAGRGARNSATIPHHPIIEGWSSAIMDFSADATNRAGRRTGDGEGPAEARKIP